MVQGHAKDIHGECNLNLAAQCPTSDGSGTGIQYDGQVDEASAKRMQVGSATQI